MRIALVTICVNHPYWQFVGPMFESAKKFLLTKHEVDFLMWTDMPPDVNYGAKTFELEGAPWPLPTLMRYHVFLQQEEILKKYDYIFYIDCDMLFVDEVGDEILGDGLTMVQHPCYAFARKFIPPYEPNPDSAAYIPRLGRIKSDDKGKQWFEPLYAAGGFQGGKAKDFIDAMWTMKRRIDQDFNSNYTAIWNDESHWNRYLFENPPAVVLDPSYCYPSSMIEVFYTKIWGRDYKPKLKTIDKRFSMTKEAGEEMKKEVEELEKLL